MSDEVGIEMLCGQDETIPEVQEMYARAQEIVKSMGGRVSLHEPHLEGGEWFCDGYAYVAPDKVLGLLDAFDQADVIYDNVDLPKSQRGSDLEAFLREHFQSRVHINITGAATPEFDSWFGDSQVVDDEGNPRVLYHGTRSPVTEFKPSRNGNGSLGMLGDYAVERHGIFAAEDPELAREFAEQGGETAGAAIQPLHLKIENPLDLTERYAYSDGLFNAIEQEAQKLDPSDKYHGFRAAQEFGELLGRGNLWKIFDKGETSLLPEQWIGILKGLGYDGLAMWERSDGDVENTKSWVAFDPSQVKSKFNQAPTESVDITASKKVDWAQVKAAAEQAYADFIVAEQGHEPAGLCYEASSILFDVLESLGYQPQLVEGYVAKEAEAKQPPSPKAWDGPHAWIELEGHVIDMTASQFDSIGGEKRTDILIMPIDRSIYSSDDQMWEMGTPASDVTAKLKGKRKDRFDAETGRINEAKELPENRKDHEFERAEWTHPNGHPRCKRCGCEEPISGTCQPGLRSEADLVQPGQRVLLHGTTLAAATKILHEGVMPSRGKWTSQHHGEGEPLAFGADTDDDIQEGTWPWAVFRAMKFHVGQELGKGIDEVTVYDCVSHGAIVEVVFDTLNRAVRGPDDDEELYETTPDEGWVEDPQSATKAPSGTEPEDLYSRDAGQPVGLIAGEDLKEFIVANSAMWHDVYPKDAHDLEVLTDEYNAENFVEGAVKEAADSSAREAWEQRTQLWKVMKTMNPADPAYQDMKKEYDSLAQLANEYAAQPTLAMRTLGWFSCNGDPRGCSAPLGEECQYHADLEADSKQPCEGCGREDLPLHTDGRCPGCSAKTPIPDDAPASPDEVSAGDPDLRRDELLDQMLSLPEGSPERAKAQETLRSFGAAEGFEYYEDETGGHVSRPRSLWRNKDYTLVRPLNATAVENGGKYEATHNGLPIILEPGDVFHALGKENDPKMIVGNWDKIEAIEPGDTIRLGFQSGNTEKLRMGNPPVYIGIFLANAQEFFDSVAEVDSLPPSIGMRVKADDEDESEVAEDEFQEPEGPSDDDIVIVPTRGGYDIMQSGRSIMPGAGADEYDLMLWRIKQYMDSTKYWPNVWEQEERGGAHLVDMSNVQKVLSGEQQEELAEAHQEAMENIEHCLTDRGAQGHEELWQYAFDQCSYNLSAEDFKQVYADALEFMVKEGDIQQMGGTWELVSQFKVGPLPESAPATPFDIDTIDPHDRQVKLDSLLDQYSAEQDPARKQQIEEQMRSLRASLRIHGEVEERTYHYRICFSTVTEESAANGDVADQGVEDEGDASLEDIVSSAKHKGIQPRSDNDMTRWWESESEPDFRNGDQTQFTLHIDQMSTADFGKVNRMLGGKGAGGQGGGGAVVNYIMMGDDAPETISDVPGMDQGRRQRKLDQLLDLYSNEQDPARKQQLEEQMRSLRASLNVSISHSKGPREGEEGTIFEDYVPFEKHADIKSRIPLLVKQFFPNDDSAVAEAHILALSKMDPTGEQGKYLTWLVKADSDNNFSEGEYPRVAELLAQYNKAKNKGGFPADKKDINRISFEQLDGLMQEFGNLQSQRELELSGYKVVRDDANWKIIEITSPSSASKLLQGKAWCVKDPKFSERYLAQGPLYWIEDKDQGQEFLIHPSSGEIKNEENDTPVTEAPRLKEELGKDRFVGSAINDMKIDVEDIVRGLGDQYSGADIPTNDLDAALDLCIEEPDSYGYHLYDVIDEMLKRDLPSLVHNYGYALKETQRPNTRSNGALLKALSVEALGDAVFESSNPVVMARFATEVLKTRWPQAEHIIMQDETAKNIYMGKFNEDEFLTPFYNEPAPGSPKALPREEKPGEGVWNEETMQTDHFQPELKLEPEPERANLKDLKRGLEYGELSQQDYEREVRQTTLAPWALPKADFYEGEPPAEGVEDTSATAPWYIKLPWQEKKDYTQAARFVQAAMCDLENAGWRVVDEKQFGVHQIVLTAHEVPAGALPWDPEATEVFQLGMQREGLDFTEVEQQTAKIPNTRLGEIAPIVNAVKAWVAQHGPLLVKSHADERTEQYFRIMTRYGLEIERAEFAGTETLVVTAERGFRNGDRVEYIGQHDVPRIGTVVSASPEWGVGGNYCAVMFDGEVAPATVNRVLLLLHQPELAIDAKAWVHDAVQETQEGTCLECGHGWNMHRMGKDNEGKPWQHHCSKWNQSTGGCLCPGWVSDELAISAELDITADVESRAPILIKQFPGFFHEDSMTHAVPFLKNLADAVDPTGQNGKYLPWIIKQITQSQWPRPDQYGDAKTMLKTYDKAKNKAGFPPEMKDINRLDFAQVMEAVDQYGDLESKREKAKSGAKVVYNQNDVTITEISTPEAAAELCKNTGWCVVNPDTAKGYLKDGPLVKIDYHGDPWALWSADGSLEGPNNERVEDGQNRDVWEAIRRVYPDRSRQFREDMNTHEDNHAEEEKSDMDRYYEGEIRFDDLDSTDMRQVLQDDEENGTGDDEFEWAERVETLIQRHVHEAVQYLAMSDRNEGRRWPNLEDRLLALAAEAPTARYISLAGDAVQYATEVMNQRWPQAEHLIYSQASEGAVKTYEERFGTLVAPYKDEQKLSDPGLMPGQLSRPSYDEQMGKQLTIPNVSEDDKVTLKTDLPTGPDKDDYIIPAGTEVAYSYGSGTTVEVKTHTDNITRPFNVPSEAFNAAVGGASMAAPTCLDCGQPAEDHPWTSAEADPNGEILRSHCDEPKMALAWIMDAIRLSKVG